MGGAAAAMAYGSVRAYTRGSIVAVAALIAGVGLLDIEPENLSNHSYHFCVAVALSDGV